MSNLQVRILPEAPNPVYHPGETLRGRIIIRAKQQVDFTNLRVSFFSRSLVGEDLMDNSQEGTLDRKGNWSAEVDATYKFAFQIPETPAQWHNRHQLAWFVRVTAEIPEDFDLDEELRIQVVAPGEERQLLQTSDEALQEPGTPGEPAKVHLQSRRPEPVPAKVRVKPGELVTSLLLSVIPLGFLVGGMVVGLNGVPDTKVPGGVRVFALLVMLGAFFVLRKFTEVKGAERFFRLVNGSLAIGVGLLGTYIMLMDTNFNWLHPQFEGSSTFLLTFPKDWNFWMGFSTAALFMPLAGYLLSGQQTKPDKLIFMSLSAPLVLLALLSAAQCVIAFQMGAGQGQLTELIIQLVVSGAGAIWLTVKPEWRNAPFVFVCMSVLPMLFVALSAFGEGMVGLALGAALLLAMAYFLYMGSRNLLAQRSLGKVTIVSDPLPTEVLLGNTQTVRVEFKPNSAVEIDHVLVQWICEETLSYNVGTERKSETNVIFQHRDHQARNQKLARDAFFRTEHSCTFLPSLKPSSDSNPYCSWRMEVKIVVKGKPDWDQVVEMTVKRG